MSLEAVSIAQHQDSAAARRRGAVRLARRRSRPAPSLASPLSRGSTAGRGRRPRTALDRAAPAGGAPAQDQDARRVRLHPVAAYPGRPHPRPGRRRLSRTRRAGAAGRRPRYGQEPSRHRPGHRRLPSASARALHHRRRAGQPARGSTAGSEPEPDAGPLVAGGTDRHR